MQHAEILIDKAIKMCGSSAELARRMGVDRAEITKLKQGKRPLSPELAAEFADIAGEDARAAAIEAIIQRNADGKKGHLLKEILGKVQAGGGVETSGISYKIGSVGAMTMIAKDGDIAKHPIHRIYSYVTNCIRRIAAASAMHAARASLACGVASALADMRHHTNGHFQGVRVA